MLKEIIRTILPAPIVGKIRIWRLNRRVARYAPRVVDRIAGGFKLHIQLADELGEGWYDKDYGELAEVAFLRQHRLRPGATVFDLGAHQCVVALMLAKVVGPEGRVIALEANKHNAEAGQKNRELNEAHNLTVMHAAAADKPGTLLFNEGLNGNVDDGTGQWGRIKVSARSIDDLSEEFGAPQVLFVDVEGFECAVLRGAAKTLKTKADWFIEAHVGCGLEKFGGSVDQIASYFPDDRFRLFMAQADDQKPRPYKAGDPITCSRFYMFAIAREAETPHG